MCFTYVYISNIIYINSTINVNRKQTTSYAVVYIFIRIYTRIITAKLFKTNTTLPNCMLDIESGGFCPANLTLVCQNAPTYLLRFHHKPSRLQNLDTPNSQNFLHAYCVRFFFKQHIGPLKSTGA